MTSVVFLKVEDLPELRDAIMGALLGLCRHDVAFRCNFWKCVFLYSSNVLLFELLDLHNVYYHIKFLHLKKVKHMIKKGKHVVWFSATTLTSLLTSIEGIAWTLKRTSISRFATSSHPATFTRVKSHVIVTQRICTPFLPKSCVLQVSAAPCDGCSCCCSTTTHAMSFGPSAIDREIRIRMSPLKWFRILSMKSWCVLLCWVASRFLTIRHSHGAQALWETSACLNLWAFCGTEFLGWQWEMAEIWNSSVELVGTMQLMPGLRGVFERETFMQTSRGDCRLRVFPSMEWPGSVDKSKERIQASKFPFLSQVLAEVFCIK